MGDVEAALQAMTARLQEEYLKQDFPADPDWRHLTPGKTPCRPDGHTVGGSRSSPRTFAERIKQVWLDEDYLRRLQQAWLKDPRLDDLSYAQNFDLWRTSNGLLERIARLSIPALLDGSEPLPGEAEIRAFASDLRSDTQYFIAVAPISGVCVEGDPLYLSEAVTVRCLSRAEHEFLINSKAFAADQRVAKEWWQYPTVVQTRLPVRYHRSLETKMDESSSMVRSARIVLSACTDSPVHSPGLYGSLETAFPLFINYGEPFSVPRASSRLWPHAITEDERERIHQMWAGLSDNPPRIKVALSRLGYLLDREEDVDCFIDAWVALEALFSGSSKSEVRYRLAFRIANFLGGQSPDKQEVFDLLYSSYDLRSRLVHGDRDQPDEKYPPQLIARTISIARECAFRAITQNRGFKPDELDSAPFLAETCEPPEAPVQPALL